ncbi:MAG: 4a-hydroxytetrahydrobiopterin dehydratase [Candidatus Eremiobacteraeota bacterium]|nr:4a-hydroxytetrahydrobiopterin dehydratase [Candidatus Eremiobacteraeota bacterium]
MTLQQGRCEACRKDAPRATPEERSLWGQELPHWTVEQEHGVDQLVRVFTFGNFSQALDFTLRVGQMADEQNHHPSILTEWGKVTVRWWTHVLGGLHRNDYICAAKSELLYA